MKKTGLEIMYAAISCSAAVSLFTSSAAAAHGISEGLMLCCEVVIPSLFPFMVLTGFMVRSPAAMAVSKPVARFMKPLLRLPESACTAVIMSFISGYPSGATMTYSLLKRGEVTAAEAERMLTFCVNAGPAMVIFAVGDCMLRSRSMGVLLLVCHILSSLIIGITGARFTERQNDRNRVAAVNAFEPAAVAFVNATSDACTQMLTICGFVTAFSCITAMLPESLSLAVPFIEVTKGSAVLAKKSAGMPIIGAALGFGGASVMCQVLSMSHGAIRPVKLMISRIINAALSYVLCSIALELFPQPVAAVSNGVQVTLSFSALTVPLTLSMLLCASTMLWTAAHKN